MATTNPPKWHQVYPQGTQAGNEEYKFFIALARHPKFGWRSVAAIEKESGLPRKRVEELLQKYYNKGMVFQSPKNEDNWGYWERVPEMLPKNEGGLASKDQKKRINKASGRKSSAGYGPGNAYADDDDDLQSKVYPMTNGGALIAWSPFVKARINWASSSESPSNAKFEKLNRAYTLRKEIEKVPLPPECEFGALINPVVSGDVQHLSDDAILKESPENFIDIPGKIENGQFVRRNG